VANFDGRWNGTCLGAQRRAILPDWGKMMVVETTTHPIFSAGNPKMLFEGHFATYQTVPSYDVTPDGQRFLVTDAGGEQRNAALFEAEQRFRDAIKIARMDGGS
jgi:hypothetical protein